MYNKQQVFIGAVIVLIGVASLLGNILNIDLGSLFCPLALIAAGALILMRPQLLDRDTPGRLKLFGDVRRRGAWQVTDEELWVGIGDVRLDMTDAHIPVGETRIRTFSFIGTVRVSVPEGVGVSVSSTAFVTDAKVLGHKRDSVITPFEMSSDGYENAERKIRLEVLAFIENLRIKQVQAEQVIDDFVEQPEPPNEILVE
ncbi:MAG: cell wall-active antibiotics response protein [Chloroflexi bacterium]|nr:cell wall-active antibiotics response protein [Chloroflexota bacterium]